MINQPLTISTIDAETQFITIASPSGNMIRCSIFSVLMHISNFGWPSVVTTTLSVIGMKYAVQETSKVRWNILGPDSI